ncbi:hypothetical protein JCGZ_18103 [Jatropha curcas]|uniref:Uncharacterized protein n=1 Tax=Jatropha curcas TaxID=180498 RepID=A0A067K1X5_JATCU|nr:hypothetical protein JCGZ_18103 [Jatropha curcas]
MVSPAPNAASTVESLRTGRWEEQILCILISSTLSGTSLPLISSLCKSRSSDESTKRFNGTKEDHCTSKATQTGASNFLNVRSTTDLSPNANIKTTSIAEIYAKATPLP